MYYGDATFIYHSDLSKYMKAEGATLENIFDYFFDVEAGIFLPE